MEKLLISIVSIAVLVITPIIGIFFGIYLAKKHLLKQNKKLEKQAVEVIEGKRENILEIDGVKYNATKFKLRDEEGKEVIVAFGPKEKEGTKQQENIYIPPIPPKKILDKFKFWKRKKPGQEIKEQVIAEDTPTKTITKQPKKEKLKKGNNPKKNNSKKIIKKKK